MMVKKDAALLCSHSDVLPPTPDTPTWAAAAVKRHLNPFAAYTPACPEPASVSALPAAPRLFRAAPPRFSSLPPNSSAAARVEPPHILSVASTAAVVVAGTTDAPFGALPRALPAALDARALMTTQQPGVYGGAARIGAAHSAQRTQLSAAPSPYTLRLPGSINNDIDGAREEVEEVDGGGRMLLRQASRLRLARAGSCDDPLLFGGNLISPVVGENGSDFDDDDGVTEEGLMSAMEARSVSPDPVGGDAEGALLALLDTAATSAHAAAAQIRSTRAAAADAILLAGLPAIRAPCPMGR
jgi:hypothetical protein